MGQYWTVFNLDNQQAKANVVSKLGEIFWSGLFLDIRLFVRPTIHSTRIWPMTDRLALIKADPKTCPFLKLPPEIMLEIAEWQDDFVDLVALCMTHDILGAILETYLYQSAEAIIMYYNWADKRVICVGDYAQDDDYPQSIQKYVKSEVQRYKNKDAAGSSFYSCFCEEAYGTVFAVSLMFSWEATKHLRKDNATRLDEVHRAVAAMDILPSVDVRVLCNLSKGEYVHERALHDKVDDKKSQYYIAHRVGLNHVLAAYICWSSDPSCSMALSHDTCESLTRGRWAGDRFEVVHEDKMRPGVDWKDVSDEAIERLARIWKEDRS